MRLYGPVNPVITDANGYDYRKLPAGAWAEGAGIELNASALAWCLASEAPAVDRYPQYARAIAHAVINAAEAARISVHSRVTMAGVKLKGGGYAPHAGHYARQRGRWCASLVWPHEPHLIEAKRALARTSAPYEARLWADLRIMDKGWQGGRRLAYDAAGLVKRRWLGRWAWVGPLPDIDPFVLCLFRPRRAGDQLETALDMVRDGRNRWFAHRLT